MKKGDVKVGEVYAVKVSGNVVPVVIDEEHPNGSWTGMPDRAACLAAVAGYMQNVRDIGGESGAIHQMKITYTNVGAAAARAERPTETSPTTLSPRSDPPPARRRARKPRRWCAAG